MFTLKRGSYSLEQVFRTCNELSCSLGNTPSIVTTYVPENLASHQSTPAHIAMPCLPTSSEIWPIVTPVFLNGSSLSTHTMLLSTLPASVFVTISKSTKVPTTFAT